MSKGYKHNQWLKDGIKASRKAMKKIWNRKVRNSDNELMNNKFYKRISGESAYCKVK